MKLKDGTPSAGKRILIDGQQRVTGHKTADIVLKHYFQPGREEFRRTLQMAMPRLLSNGQVVAEKSPKEGALEILRNMTAKTWKKDCVRALELLAPQ